MRISDWSSTCALPIFLCREWGSAGQDCGALSERCGPCGQAVGPCDKRRHNLPRHRVTIAETKLTAPPTSAQLAAPAGAAGLGIATREDRQGDARGKSVSIRGDFGCERNIQQHK